MNYGQHLPWIRCAMILCVLCLGLCSVPVLPASAGEDDTGARVAYQFKAGDSQEYKIEFSQEYEVRGYSFYTLIDIQMTETCIESKDDTLFSMEVTINEVSAQMKRNDDLMDSGLDEEMTGKKFAFSINKNGMISNIHSKEYLASEDEVLNTLQVILSGSYPYLPDETLGVDGSWIFKGSTLRDLKTDIVIESDSKATIKEFKKEMGRQCAVITRAGDSYVSGRVENQSGTFVLDGEGKNKAKFFLTSRTASSSI